MDARFATGLQRARFHIGYTWIGNNRSSSGATGKGLQNEYHLPQQASRTCEPRITSWREVRRNE
jgi:hypothetical protein